MWAADPTGSARPSSVSTSRNSAVRIVVVRSPNALSTIGASCVPCRRRSVPRGTATSQIADRTNAKSTGRPLQSRVRLNTSRACVSVSSVTGSYESIVISLVPSDGGTPTTPRHIAVGHARPHGPAQRDRSDQAPPAETPRLSRTVSRDGLGSRDRRPLSLQLAMHTQVDYRGRPRAVACRSRGSSGGEACCGKGGIDSALTAVSQGATSA